MLWRRALSLIMLGVILNLPLAPAGEWEFIIDGSKDLYRVVQFVSPLEGWIASPTAGLLHSNDGGNNWEVVDLKERVEARVLHFLNKSEGWVGGGNLLLHTKDGGRSWRRMEFEELEIITDLCFASSQKGWVAGYKGKPPHHEGKLLYTDDGGGSWKIGWRSKGETPYKLFFLDDRNGWLSAFGGSGQRIYRMTDGERWEAVELGMIGPIMDLFFIDEKEGWGAGWGGEIIHTCDGGRSWEIQLNTGFPGLTFYAVLFINRKKGWAVGLAPFRGGGVVLHTEDGGGKWEEIFRTGGMKYLRDICYTGGDSIFVVGNGVILRYRDPDLRRMIGIKPLERRMTILGEVKGRGWAVCPETELLQNYPNPFNLETWIPFRLSKPSDAVIRIYDVKGRMVREIKVEAEGAGLHAVRWDGRDGRGEEVSGGTYFYSLEAGRFKAVRKMTVIK